MAIETLRRQGPARDIHSPTTSTAYSYDPPASGILVLSGSPVIRLADEASASARALTVGRPLALAVAEVDVTNTASFFVFFHKAVTIT